MNVRVITIRIVMALTENFTSLHTSDTIATTLINNACNLGREQRDLIAHDHAKLHVMTVVLCKNPFRVRALGACFGAYHHNIRALRCSTHHPNA